ncbi:hypothetical protein IWQ62_004203 [Dispira parvispora]|uniref:Uncharacterized protein n=1 Tax=Dispira parvispora TaxID=1520584 RepID=A0A9W8AMV4_9FUNG|nr:hypothetical protein IWQ62_004203 [Dispira parvispora]
MALESIFNRRNRVPEMQRHYQTNLKAPLYLRGGPRDKLMVYGVYTMLSFGVAYTAFEFSKLMRGIKE